MEAACADDAAEEEPNGVGQLQEPAPESVSESASSEEAPAHLVMQRMPAYPFPKEFVLEFHGARGQTCIEVISKHIRPQHQRSCAGLPGRPRVLALFLPGVHGGVGPCRMPGSSFDPEALFPTVVSRLESNPEADVDCYRCSWPYMRPDLSDTVGGACRVLHHGVLEAMKDVPPEESSREIRVLFMGHSLGGSVVVRTAMVVAQHFGADGAGGRHLEGLERAVVHVAGICTLNGAYDLSRASSASHNMFAGLSECKACIICGDADDVVPPEISTLLFEALPMQRKRLLVLPGGTHDLYSFKEQLVNEVVDFVMEEVQVESSKRG